MIHDPVKDHQETVHMIHDPVKDHQETKWWQIRWRSDPGAREGTLAPGHRVWWAPNRRQITHQDNIVLKILDSAVV